MGKTQLRLFKPVEGATYKVDLRYPAQVAFMHRPIGRGEEVWSLKCSRIVCPICEALTAETRAQEFRESRLDWTW